MYDTALGLPLHPLLVHLPIVLLPLSAVGVVVLVVAPSLRRRLAVPTLILLAIGALGSIAAMLSGNALAERVGQPGGHAQLGTALVVASICYLLLAGGWLLGAARPERQGVLASALGWLSAVASVGIVALTVAVGHSGASAVWSGVTGAGAESARPSTPATAPDVTESTRPSASEAPSASASPTATGITMAVVAEHGDADSCWAAIDGKVYDLTGWIKQHPGGQSPILSLCGTDATAAFTAKHAGDSRPAEELASMLVGPLVS